MVDSLSITEDNNTRVLFEKVLATMPVDRTKYVRWTEYL